MNAVSKLYIKFQKSNLNKCFFCMTPNFRKKVVDPGIELDEKKWQLEFHQIEPKSRRKIYDKKPFKAKIVEGKTYKWCACGFSHSQPYCDGTHSIPRHKITLKPLFFKAPTTREVWLCNCKKTKNPPFCDGTHREKEVQDAFEQGFRAGANKS